MARISERIAPAPLPPLWERTTWRLASGEIFSCTIAEAGVIRGHWTGDEIPDPLPGPRDGDGRKWLCLEVVETARRDGPAVEVKPPVVPPEDGRGSADALRAELEALEAELADAEEEDENGTDI